MFTLHAFDYVCLINEKKTILFNAYSAFHDEKKTEFFEPVYQLIVFHIS